MICQFDCKGPGITYPVKATNLVHFSHPHLPRLAQTRRQGRVHFFLFPGNKVVMGLRLRLGEGLRSGPGVAAVWGLWNLGIGIICSGSARASTGTLFFQQILQEGGGRVHSGGGTGIGCGCNNKNSQQSIVMVDVLVQSRTYPIYETTLESLESPVFPTFLSLAIGRWPMSRLQIINVNVVTYSCTIFEAIHAYLTFSEVMHSWQFVP